MDIMNIYNSITDIDLQFNNGYSKFTIMYSMIQLWISRTVCWKIDIHNLIVGVNI